MDVIVEVICRLPCFHGHGIVCPQLSSKGSQPFGIQGKGNHPTLPVLGQKTDHKVGGV